MKRVDPSKLLVTVMPPATLVRPVDGRRYTLSESNDQKNDLHLRIGYHFDHNQDEKSEDKLLGIWTYQQGIYILDVTVLMNTNENSEMDATMLTELSGKMEDYLTAFVIGDIQFYKDFPWLLDAPIYINLKSINERFKTKKYYGTPRKYLLNYKHLSNFFAKI